MKKLLCVILSLIIGLSFSGCNRKTVTDSVTLKLGLPGGKDLTPMEIVEGFKAANPNITLDIDESPWNEFKKKLKMQVAASNPPNTFIMDSGYVASLGGMGAAVDLSDRVKKDIKTDEYSGGLFAGKDGEGHLWGIPHGLNAVAVYYNKAMLDKAGIPYPTENWTFEEMLDITKKLTKDTNGDGTTDQYGIAYGTYITDGWLPFVTATGGAPLDETRSKSNFTNEKTIEGFKRFIEPVRSGNAPNAEWIASNGNAASAFYMGKVAMLMTLSAQVKNINSNAPAGFDYDVQMMPIGWDGNRHCVYVPNLWAVFSRSTKAEQEAAWAWIKYFIGEEAQMKVADTLYAGYPIKLSALEHINSKENRPKNIQAFFKGLDKDGVTLFENKTFEEWRPKVDEVSAKMAIGHVTLEEGIKQIESLVSEALVNEKN